MAGKLLREPNTADMAIAERAEVRFQRPVAEYEDLGSAKFRLSSRDFQRQYFDIYRHRYRCWVNILPQTIYFLEYHSG